MRLINSFIFFILKNKISNFVLIRNINREINKEIINIIKNIIYFSKIDKSLIFFIY